MAKKQLFEYCILRHKTINGTQVETEVVQLPKFILARTEIEVNKKAAKQIPDDLDDHLEEVEILCRPFCG